MKSFCRTRVFALSLMFALPAFAAPDVSPVRFGLSIEMGNLSQAREWLDDGLNPNFIGDRVGSGLMIAAWENNIPMMELFYSRGGRIDQTNKNGEQALQLAALKGNLAAVKWLLDHGASVNRPDRQWSALHYAVFGGHREITQLLISRGADVNARVPNDATALMLAAREGHEVLADDLIKAGADPRMTNDLGENALNWAMLHDHPAIAKLVSSPEAFANAVRSQPAQRTPPIRSIAAPSQIDDLLRRISYAEAQNLPTAGLRKALMTAVERIRLETKRAQQEAERKQAGAVKGIVITAQRQGGGEKAEIVYDRTTTTVPGSNPSKPVEAPTIRSTADAFAASVATSGPAIPPVVDPARPAGGNSAKADNVALILAKIRVAKSNGEPVDALRKELFEAISGFKGDAAKP